MLQQVYIGEVDLEEEETQDTLITMVEMLKTNKYIRLVTFDQAEILLNDPQRSASVDFWLSAFKESEPEEEGTFFKQLGSFLMDQTRYLQVRGKKSTKVFIFVSGPAAQCDF